MLERKHFVIRILFGLYLVTWVGGWISHERALKVQAEARYQRSKQHFQEKLAELQESCLDLVFLKEFAESRSTYLFPDGPKAKVNWCVPLLPFVLLSSTDCEIGPMAGGGDFNIVFYYGFWANGLCFQPRWRA